MIKIKVGIIGGSGYTGGELIRILLYHPFVELDFVHSRTYVGQEVSVVHRDLIGEISMMFTDDINKYVDVVFLCVGHGESNKILSYHIFAEHTKIIDLSQDFRLQKGKDLGFVYGLPELNRTVIQGTNRIANPGCFATGIQLALLPLFASNLVESGIHIDATTGSTGAGQSMQQSSHFSWRANNLSVYKAFQHQHLAEIQQTMRHFYEKELPELTLIPKRGGFTRGIFASITLETTKDLDFLKHVYQTYYQTHPFVQVCDLPIDLKLVVNTNKCLIYLEKYNNKLLIECVIDNLLKGASGQAVQNMNIMFGWDEKVGLNLKASYY